MSTRAIAVLAVAVLLAGCVSKDRFSIASIKRKMLQLEVGMAKAEVLALMGTPESREVFPDASGEPVEFLFYQTRFAGDAVIFVAKDSDKTPFAFRNGHLVGWSRNYYDQTIRHEITIKQP